MFGALNYSEDSPRKPFPFWAHLLWLLAAPAGLIFSARILWEKTLLTAERGEQMIGFSLAHVYPVFFLVGLLCSWVLMGWLLVAIVYLIRARLRVAWYDYAMVAGSLFVCLALFLPHDFGLTLR
jgi:hypothetical protein